jgi:hypothetical protein
MIESNLTGIQYNKNEGEIGLHASGYAKHLRLGGLINLSFGFFCPLGYVKASGLKNDIKGHIKSI